MTTFNAAVQYRDWYGECKADNIDKGDLRDYLRKNNLIGPNDFVVAFRLWNGENSPGQPLHSARVTVGVVPAASYEQAEQYLQAPDPIKIREVSFSMSMDEFFHLFERFSIAVNWQSLDLVGREVET
jgi:hypothetical protein